MQASVHPEAKQEQGPNEEAEPGEFEKEFFDDEQGLEEEVSKVGEKEQKEQTETSGHEELAQPMVELELKPRSSDNREAKDNSKTAEKAAKKTAKRMKKHNLVIAKA